MTATRARCAGFTLLELLTAVAVAITFLAIVPPTFTSIIKSVRLKSQIYDFNGALDLARSEAVMRGITVTVCASANQTSCGPGGTNWESGWIVFVDSNSNQKLDGGETILRTGGALMANYRLRATSTTTLTSAIMFTAKGAPSASGTFVLCYLTAINPARAILINTSGLITAAQDRNGVPRNSDGTDMTTCTP